MSDEDIICKCGAQSDDRALIPILKDGEECYRCIMCLLEENEGDIIQMVGANIMSRGDTLLDSE